MVELNRMRRFYILPVVMLLFMLNACGMQGDLYLPEAVKEALIKS